MNASAERSADAILRAWRCETKAQLTAFKRDLQPRRIDVGSLDRGERWHFLTGSLGEHTLAPGRCWVCLDQLWIDEPLRGQGALRRYLDWLENDEGVVMISVADIQNERLRRHLCRRGFTGGVTHAQKTLVPLRRAHTSWSRFDLVLRTRELALMSTDGYQDHRLLRFRRELHARFPGLELECAFSRKTSGIQVLPQRRGLGPIRSLLRNLRARAIRREAERIAKRCGLLSGG